MIPVSFDESNVNFSREVSDNAPPDTCTIMPAVIASDAADTPLVVTCWKMTVEDMEEFKRTGRIWLIVAGNFMPLTIMSATSPFTRKEDSADGSGVSYPLDTDD